MHKFYSEEVEMNGDRRDYWLHLQLSIICHKFTIILGFVEMCDCII